MRRLINVVFDKKTYKPKFEEAFAVMDAELTVALTPPPTLRETLIAHADDLDSRLEELNEVRDELTQLIQQTMREVASLRAAIEALDDDPKRP